MKIYNKFGELLIELPGDSLANADLRGADLSNAILSDADLSDTKLYKADLRHADLSNTDLNHVDLSYADLYSADLNNADLSGANLSGANLSGADLKGANLKDTCLDPESPIPAIDTSEILEAGLQIEGEYVVGFRTKTSQHCGNTVYESGKTYVAPWFSVASTECHPGLYLASKDWLAGNGYQADNLISVRCLRSDLHKAGNKWRCKKLEVL